MSAPAARLWIAGIGALLAGGGCGFKGPLYLPERNATVVTRPASATQAAPPPGQTQPPAAENKGQDKGQKTGRNNAQQKGKSSPPSSSPPASAPQSPPPQ